MFQLSGFYCRSLGFRVLLYRVVDFNDLCRPAFAEPCAFDVLFQGSQTSTGIIARIARILADNANVGLQWCFEATQESYRSRLQENAFMLATD